MHAPLQVGDTFDVQDTMQKWCVAQVVVRTVKIARVRTCCLLVACLFGLCLDARRSGIRTRVAIDRIVKQHIVIDYANIFISMSLSLYRTWTKLKATQSSTSK